MAEIYLPAAVRRRNATLGSETLIYFRRLSDQHLIIPPVCWARTPRGYVRMEANSARELEKVSREFEKQKEKAVALTDDQIRRIESKHAEIRSRLHAAKHCAGTSNTARDMIDLALKRLDEGEQALKRRSIHGHLSIEAG